MFSSSGRGVFGHPGVMGNDNESSLFGGAGVMGTRGNGGTPPPQPLTVDRTDITVDNTNITADQEQL